ADARFHQALAERFLGSHQTDGGVDTMIASRKQTQALRRLVEQFCLGKNTPTDRDNGISGQNKGAAQLIVQIHISQRRRGLGMGKARRVSAWNLAAMRRLVEVRRLQRIGLDPGLIDQGKPSRRTGRKDEFWATDHLTAK